MVIKLYILCNDAKWVEKIDELDFFPFHGLDFQGLAGEQPLRVNSVSWDMNEKFFKVRLSWMSQEIMTTKEMVDLAIGWTVK